ncbi:Uncharacterised protein [Sphingobacterium multivorum]|uniref:hypothetical protein n=1 Tax=Sphingobacterium multivorum TaxID=28454 RepID=UPI000E07722A|nr:hypothetical protein [Sphingobacterium multivorum]QQT44877.1 hypothetical protein I6J00_24805 [Sphingobacterium multivorum]SUJ18193.1 Uncharacterised protein [Sphingobacterium multivorum]
MENLFVPYELAVKLKELGYDESSISGYMEHNGEITLVTKLKDQYPISNTIGFGRYNYQNKKIVKAPLWQQAFDWFRAKKGTFGFVGMLDYGKFCFQIERELTYEIKYDTYEEARFECLKYMIERLEQFKKNLDKLKEL